MSCELGAHCLVGAEALIAARAEVAESVVGDGARSARERSSCARSSCPGSQVGAGAVVIDTILGPRAVVGEGARLSGMTIVAAGASVPAFAVLDGERYPSA